MVSFERIPPDQHVTERQYIEKCIAACPAELAPPTTNTSCPRYAGASEAAAP